MKQQDLSGQRVYVLVMSQPSRLNPQHNIRSIVGVFQESTLDEARQQARRIINKMKDDFGDVIDMVDRLDEIPACYTCKYKDNSFLEVTIEKQFIQ